MKSKVGPKRDLGIPKFVDSWSEVQVAWGSSKGQLASEVRAVLLGNTPFDLWSLDSYCQNKYLTND